MTMILDGTGGVTFPAGGVGNPASAVVGLTDTQTLTNKTLTAPTLASANITTALTLTGASGTSGQALTSQGSGVAPIWSTIGASAATPTARGTVFGLMDSGSAGITATGWSAGAGLTSGANNVFNGFRAGFTTSSGTFNTFVGPEAGYGQTTGQRSVAVGYSALYTTNTGSYNVAVGSESLYNCGSSQNTAVGFEACKALTSSGDNVALGFRAGYLTIGSTNVFIGNTTTGSGASNNYEIVIGTGGTTGKGSSTGYINPNGGGVYQGNNSSSWSTTSDRRLKKNITDNTEGLEKISQIRVRNFEYRLPEEVTELEAHSAIDKTGVQLGVIAQELQQVCPDCIKEESTTVLSVDTSNLTWHMVNAIKDLKALNDTQAATITALTARIVALESA